MQKEPHNTFIMGDKTYDFAKKLVQIILPAFGSLYLAMSAVWDLPNAEQVTASVVIVTTFLGACLGISTSQYNSSGRGIDGSMTVSAAPPNGSPVITGISLPKTEEELEGKKSITLKVEHETALPPVDFEEDDPDDDPPMNPATVRKRPSKKK